MALTINERRLDNLQYEVARELPMFTLAMVQRRQDGYQHWRVSREGVTFAVSANNQPPPDHAWQGYRMRDQWVDPKQRPTLHTIRELQAQKDRLLPQADEMFRQVTAPTLVMQSINREHTLSPRDTLYAQLQGILLSYSQRLHPLVAQWPEQTFLIDVFTLASRETLRFDSRGPQCTWSGPIWGMYEHLETVMAQLASWERLCQTITREFREAGRIPLEAEPQT